MRSTRDASRMTFGSAWTRTTVRFFPIHRVHTPDDWFCFELKCARFFTDSLLISTGARLYRAALRLFRSREITAAFFSNQTSMHSRHKCNPSLTQAKMNLYTLAIAVGTLPMMRAIFNNRVTNRVFESPVEKRSIDAASVDELVKACVN